MNIPVFWDVTPFSSMKIYRNFIGISRLHRHGQSRSLLAASFILTYSYNLTVKWKRYVFQNVNWHYTVLHPKKQNSLITTYTSFTTSSSSWGWNFNNSVPISQMTYFAFITKPNQSMMFKKVIAIYCENHMKHVNIHCGQNAEFLNLVVHIVLNGSTSVPWVLLVL
jgi:hypothetical protein